MPVTKRYIIEQAHNEIGLGSYAYDAQPDDLQDALFALNALMGQWASEGALVGWPSVNAELADDLDADSNLPIDAVRGVVAALAVDIAPSFGKDPKPKTLLAAERGRKLMIHKNSVIPQRAMDATSIPLGAGWKNEDQINLNASDNVIEEGEISRD